MGAAWKRLGRQRRKIASSKHLVEMAEKRAMSRAVLNEANLYECGVFEDEDVHRD